MGNNICCQDSHQKPGLIERQESQLQVKKVVLQNGFEEKQEDSKIKEEKELQNSLEQLVHSHHQPKVQILQSKQEPEQEQEERQQEQQIQIPPLWPRAKETIEKHNFFQNEFSFISNPHSRKYGEDVYVGQLDEEKVRPNGLGKMYKQDGSIYIGHFHHGKAHGKGAYIFGNGSYYHGQFNNNKAETLQEFGQYESQHLKYRGGFKDNAFHGSGKQVGDGYTFQGHYHNGSRSKGKLSWKSKDGDYEYQGQFNSQNKLHGKGKLIQPTGKYEGQFSEGEKHGQGQYKGKNGTKYIGQYTHNARTGTGTIYSDDGQIAYSGQLLNGLPHGKGYVFENGKKQEAEWVQGIDSSLIVEE